MLLKNKTAVITGCNRGIGFSILELFSKNGANIIACVRKYDLELEKKIKTVSSKYKNKIDLVYFNLENEQEIEKGFLDIKNLNIKIDILINNAGINQMSLFQMTSLEKFKSVFQINFFSVISFTQKILKLLSKNSYSKIINISSNAAQLNSPGRAAYAPSKAALISFTKVLSKEVGNTKICVNAIAPGLVNTDMMKDTSPKIIDEILTNTPLKKVAEPEDVANSALFLASSLSNHVTGEIVFVTGGYE
jgi:3-oxoacyl-[acyl-carrier protein] reductase|tara:strand:+ start:902 stop:1645 length:744 start_codon:yes stop_codon:yes gene_type:complete